MKIDYNILLERAKQKYNELFFMASSLNFNNKKINEMYQKMFKKISNRK